MTFLKSLFFFLQRLTACKLEAYQVALSKTHQLSMEFGPFLVDVVLFYQFSLISAPSVMLPNYL